MQNKHVRCLVAVYKVEVVHVKRDLAYSYSNGPAWDKNHSRSLEKYLNDLKQSQTWKNRINTDKFASSRSE